MQKFKLYYNPKIIENKCIINLLTSFYNMLMLITKFKIIIEKSKSLYIIQSNTIYALVSLKMLFS